MTDFARANAGRNIAVRAALVASLAAGTIAGIPLVRSYAVPAAVVRTQALEVSTMAGPATRGVRVDAAGSLRTERFAGRTKPVSVCAPIWFDGLAVTWSRSSRREPNVLVRTGRNEGTLGKIVELDPEGGADPGTPEYGRGAGGSTYLWTGASRCARIWLDLASRSWVAGLRVVFVNSSGTSAGPTTGPPQIGPLARDGASPLPSAEPRTAEPKIITRQQWGANPRLMNCTPDVADFLDVGFVHHTAGPNSYSRAEADDVVRGIYAYHTQVRGWCDIGYNFLVDRYGDIFEGRSGGITENVIGAAQMGFNTGAFSVSLMGTFDASRPPRVAIRALQRLLAWRLDIAHVNPRAFAEMTSAGGRTTRYEKGTVVRLHVISGHRDTGLTSCPGAALYRLLRRVRRVVGRLGLPKIYEPRLSTTTFVAGEAQRLRIGARGSAWLSWSVTILGPDGARVAELPAQDGDRLALWSRPVFDAAGAYRVIIAASDRSGRHARPAELELVVKAPAPSPTPSASPSPSATPSPSASLTA
jgi:hypothetical protein